MQNLINLRALYFPDSQQKKTEEVYLVNLEKDDQWFEDARDFLDKLLLIGTNKNLVLPRQPQEFSRVLFDRGTSLFCGSFILRNCSEEACITF